jgi:hypothetical protein
MTPDQTLLEERLRGALRGAPTPDGLTVPDDLADTVLRDLRRRRHRRRTHALLAAAAAATAAAITLPLTVLGGHRAAAPGPPAGRTTAPPVGTINFPAYGGGPKTIWAYTITGTAGTNPTTYLLDARTGSYRRTPYPVALSPDARTAAVENGGRIGLAGVADLVRRGAPAIRWLDLPPGSPPLWSPDGTALLTTSTDGPVTTAHRYEVAAGLRTDTPITVPLIGAVGWAADSRRYVALLRGTGTDHGAVPAGLASIEPDGAVHPGTIDVHGVIGGAASYSPSGRYALADASGLSTPTRLASQVLDLRTGRATPLPYANASSSWYDDHTVLLLGYTGPSLNLYDLRTNSVARSLRVDLPPGAALEFTVQTGPSARLTGTAATLGF